MVGRDADGHFLGFRARLNCENMPVIPAWLVRRNLNDPRRIPYLSVWKDECDGELKEAVRLATPSANRARGATDRSTAGGRPRSILGDFLQTSGARRFDGVEPGSRARGKHATGRSTTELRGAS
ncbi:MAG: hypothetical protein DMG54_25715 [Acidobacteria bacterium]|nr:MAG: hypothetical protein DMG53_27445 [Acidobacteriota bacterium]PYU39812.1 MAG: hypothetical protein DMG54_25715 [Acidobacteriota bacterium]PYU69974.1 MAG: hypothetical protein DMG52_27315 [Acidobacteriota bacterium]